MERGTVSVMEGSIAVARAVKACRPAVISAYPITPQTHIIEALAEMVARGELDSEYIRADSEFSAISILAGASATGVRTYTASASQGLLLMTEMLYYLAGARLPVVLTGTNRQISVPLGLQPDHRDTMGFRDTGIIQLYVEDVQEAYDTHLQAFKIAEDHQILLPTMVCMDGFVLTHVVEPVRILDQADIDDFVPPYQPVHYLTPEKPSVFGSFTDDTNTLEFYYLLQQAALNAKSRIEAVAREFQIAFGRHRGGLIDTYMTDDAEVILIAMGSAVGTLREAVDVLRKEGIKVGMIKVRSFRPFPSDEIRCAAAQASAVAVFDRSLSFGFQGVLATDVKAALYDSPTKAHPWVLGTTAGFGGREVTIDTVREIVTYTRRLLDSDSVPLDEVRFIGLKMDLLRTVGAVKGGRQD
jgi:pyruvate ferredoxin oxidoreductase alpha subunit